MKSVLHKAKTRGHANHGWLDTWHTFSFADYYDPERIHFGVLRVLNDDTIAPGKGFGMHPHDNMEIITIPLYGALEHKDSMDNSAVIESGDVQVMSAGTGIMHSEFNKNSHKEVRLLQIWVFANKADVEPRYDQVSLKDIEKEDEMFQILSPDSEDEGVWIYQDAWFHMGNLSEGWKGKYRLKKKSNGVYLFVIEGDLTVEGEKLNKRDGMGVWDTNSIALKAESRSKVLLMEVPMAR